MIGIRSTAKSKRKCRSQLFFPIGLVSLILLPQWFFMTLSTDKRLDRHAMEILLPPIGYMESLRKTAHSYLDVPPTGKCERFGFVGIEPHDSIELERLTNQVHHFVSARDTSMGIRINFYRSARYSCFVGVIDMLNMQQAVRWAILDSEIWLPNYPRSSAFRSADTIDWHDTVIHTYVADVSAFEKLRSSSLDWFTFALTVPPGIIVSILVLFVLNVRHAITIGRREKLSK